MDLLNKNQKQLAAEYRGAYRAHQEVAATYAKGNCGADVLRSSAARLKLLRAAYRVAGECV